MSSNTAIRICFLNQSFYDKYKDCSHLLDMNDKSKQGKRPCLLLETNLYPNLKFLVPLETKMWNKGRLGKLVFGYPLPLYPSKKEAGLDYRSSIVINDETDIKEEKTFMLPDPQYRKLKTDYAKIYYGFTNFLNTFIDAYKNNSYLDNHILASCSFLYFLKELGLDY